MKKHHLLKTGVFLLILVLTVALETRVADAFVLTGVRAWKWGNWASIYSVAKGNVDADGQTEIVTGGAYSDGTRTVAQLCVWSGPTLTLENVRVWYWTSHTGIESVAVGNVDGDGQVEIVTGGSFFDGARNVAQLVVWNGATLAVENVKTWYWTSDTLIRSVAIGDVDGDGQVEIVTGGYYSDGTKLYAQLCVWNGASLVLERVKAWSWGTVTDIYSVAVGDLTGDGGTEIVTGGKTDTSAQLCVWTGATLALQNVRTWIRRPGTSNNVIRSVVIGNVDSDGPVEIVTAGYYYDGTAYDGYLVVWDSATVWGEVERPWFYDWGPGTGGTFHCSVATGDINNDAKTEIVCGGYSFDGHRENAVLSVWQAPILDYIRGVTAWYWTGDTRVYSVVVGDVNGDGKNEMVTGGNYWDGWGYNAQLCVWAW